MSTAGGTTSSGTLDDAYERLSRTGPEFHGWLSNHGPMAADALARIGYADAVGAWVERYKARLEERPCSRWGFEEGEWREFLGDASRLGDWLDLFARLVSYEPWQDVLARWWPRLVPGAPAAATHGLIRTGHAVRALRENETGARRRELGEGLGYWAARWQPLPSHQPVRGRQELAAAIEDLPRAAAEGGTRTRLGHVARDQRYLAAVGSVAAPAEAELVPMALRDLTDEAVRCYLRWGHGNPVMLVHAATAARAAMLVLPALPRHLWLETFDYLWTTSAAVLAAYRPAQEPATGGEGPAVTPAEVAEAAVRHGDEHVIKFAEVALESHARGVREALAAAARATTLITPE